MERQTAYATCSPFFRFLVLLEEEVNNKKFKRLSFEVCSAANCTIT